MKRSILLALMLITLGVGLAFIASGHRAPAPRKLVDAPDDQAFALLELFTSQGCSSCPPADKLVQKMAEQPRVFVLAYHVDYWDHLGWKDPYSLKESTQRQKWYNQDLHVGTTYTPQVVVNGKAECVGSNKAKLQEHIKSALSQAVKARIQLTVNATAGPMKTLGYTLNGQWKGTQLVAAVVENGVKTEIKRGENAGKKLPYSNIVRSIQVIKSLQKDSGTLEINVPNDSGDGITHQLVVFLQKPQSGEIYALARTEL